jgi:steroid 5-alpha reductase family enzyme
MFDYLWIVFVIIAGIQLLCYIPSAILKTERFYDLSGAITYQATFIYLIIKQDPHPRQIILTVMGLLWCTRLGFFLFKRVLSVTDHRFEELKSNPVRFLIPWVLQIVWIFLTALPIYIVVGNSNQQPLITWSDYIGIAVWVFGFGCESLADYQKSVFKKAHPNDFVTTGIWRYSRFANYFGEVVLWFGIFIIACQGVLVSWQWVICISPCFVFCLLVFGSGVKLTEQSQEKRYGSRLDYQEYKRKTSKFFLWFPKDSV